MNPIIRNILAIMAGSILGGLVNMGIIMISGSIIPPPEGADITTMEGLKSTIHLFKPRHFLFPFLAHALGTFTGAALAVYMAATHKKFIALLIGIMFLIGGIKMISQLPSPLWYAALDLGLAYIPMAWLGYKLVKRA